MGRQPFAKRRHSPEFKVEAVRVMKERMAAGVTLARVSDELEVGPDLLRVWRRQVEEAPSGATATEIFPGHGRRRLVSSKRSPKLDRPLSLEQEVERLRRENERLLTRLLFQLNTSDEYVKSLLLHSSVEPTAAFFAKESR